jgi:hypothetical protein
MMTPLVGSKPSISARSWLRVCSRSSLPPNLPPSRLFADGVDLVDEHDAGGLWLGLLKEVADREAPTPTNISTKSEPEMEKNGTLASPATALASSVLPVPGGPTSSAPLGSFAPMAVYFWGCAGSR